MTAADAAGAAPEPVCVVTGASSGIGRAIAMELAAGRRHVLAVSRDREALEQLAAEAGPGPVDTLAADLRDESAPGAVATRVATGGSGASALVLCAGIYRDGRIADTPIDHLDEMYAANLRPAYRLIQALLPELERASGYLIVINSSAGLATRPGIAGHNAVQFALRAFTDSLRDEINHLGIRVLSVHPGRTATPRMERIFAAEGRTYNAELLLQPQDIARLISFAISLPETAELTSCSIRPAKKSY